MKPPFRRIALALGLVSIAGTSLGAENKLVATVADISGRCLLEGSWVDVVDRYIYWEVSGPNVHTKWHKSNLIHPRGAARANIAEDSVVLRSPIAFALNLRNDNFPTSRSEARLWPELAYRDSMRVKLKKPNLTAAVVVHRVDESDLWELNLTSGANIFSRDKLDSKHYVPTRYSVCDVEVKYLMNKAEAVFKRPLIGKVVIKTNQTVPLNPGKRSFAEEILDRRD